MMHLPVSRSFRLLLPLLLAAMPLPAAAGGALLFKGGVLRIDDSSQPIDGVMRAIDQESLSNFAISLEHRARRGMAFGVEYLRHEREFTPPASPSPGELNTQILQFVARKYFIDQGIFHPYLGMGVGVAYTSYKYWNGVSTSSDGDGSFVLQGTFGAEFRFDNLSLVTEFKRYWHEVGLNDYNPGGNGLFIGMGFNW